MDQKKWGIIYCPKSGSFRPQKRWEKIEKALRLNHIDYDFVQSEQSNFLYHRHSQWQDERFRAFLGHQGQ